MLILLLLPHLGLVLLEVSLVVLSDGWLLRRNDVHVLYHSLSHLNYVVDLLVIRLNYLLLGRVDGRSDLLRQSEVLNLATLTLGSG